MQIRPAWPRDLEACAALDHSYTTNQVWQVEVREENGVPTVTFRLARLPREVRVNYPRQDDELLAGWQQRDGFLVAVDQGYIHGYVGLTAQAELGIARVGDLVVDRPSRRRGVGTALLKAASQWGREQELGWLLVEVQTKNYPAIRFCRSRGLTFCGYNDHYWPSRDIVLFFGESLR
jgi:GNAT superfamily N-acetyltransferase